MKHFFTTVMVAILSCTLSVAQWGGGGFGFDFGGGGSAGSGSLSGYTSKTNIDYVGDNHVGHKLDIYYPNDNQATHNVIIHIYGSAWGSNSSKGDADHGTVGKAALEAGYIFVTPNHRTYNDALWPAQINDIKAVVRYLRGNAKELNIDDSFIGISGFSSGGHLASMMGVTNGLKGDVKISSRDGSKSCTIDVEGNLGKYTSSSSWVDAVCDWSGPVDCLDKGCGNPINMSPENDMVGGCSPQSCPEKHASLGTNAYIELNKKNIVPHMVCHGTTDNIVPCCEGEKYRNNLKSAGIYTEWYNPSHGHNVNENYTDEMINFFNKIRSEKAAPQGGGDQGGNQGGEQGGGDTSDSKDNFQIYIAIGQSNMWGNAQVQSSDKATHDRIKMMSTANSRGNVGSWIPAVPPMCAPSSGYSLADNFIRVMADNAPECVTIGIIPVAIAGASFKAFDPNQCGSYFSSSESWLQNMAKEYDNNPYKRIVECAKKAQETGVIKGIIVHQGESDSGQSAWLTMVSTFYNNICKELGLDPSKTPILVGQMLEGGACAGHNTVIAQLPGKISNCGVVKTNNIPGESDRLHFTHDGYKELGKRYAEMMLEMADLNSNCGGGSQGGGSTPQTGAYQGKAADVPGKVEAEFYDEGGSGVAYKDTDTKNEGDAKFRTDEYVDIVKAGNGMAVGYTTTAEWLQYTINVTKAGDYYIGANMSCGTSDPACTISIDGKKVASITGTGVSQDWDTYAIGAASGKVTLTAGEHIMKVQIDAANTNVDYIIFSEESLGGSEGGGDDYTGSACDNYPALSGGTRVQSNSDRRDIGNGFHYEIWYDGKKGSDASMYYFKDKKCAFKSTWNENGDYLARVGLYWGQQNNKNYKALGGDLHCDFNYVIGNGSTGGGYNYIGIYGWTTSAKECEYYIVENTFFGGTAKQQGLYYNTTSRGKYKLDGDEYELWVGTRQDAPSASGNSTFTQIFAVRKTARSCGHISISDHFKNWERLGVDVITGNLYDCKFLCEVGAGKGSFELRYGNIWIGEAADVLETNANVENGIVLAPNPAENYVSVMSNETIEKVELVNTMGQIVSTQYDATNIELSVPAGIYFVQAYTKSGSVYVERLVVK